MSGSERATTSEEAAVACESQREAGPAKARKVPMNPWDRDSDIEADKQPWTWPRAFARVGTSFVFWLAVVGIVYLAVRYG